MEPSRDNEPFDTFLSDVFPSLEKGEIEELSRIVLRTQYSENELIAQEGSYASGIYIVKSGLVSIGKYSSKGRDKRCLRFLSVGEMFGLEAIFLEREAVNVQFAKTLIESTLVFFERSNILAFSKDHPHIFKDLCRWLAREVIMLEFKLTRETVESQDRNLALLLLALSNKYGVCKQQGAVCLELPIPRQTMAEMLGTSVETLMRGLKRFRELGLLGPEHGKIIIQDSKRLAERARVTDFYLSIMEETL
ncbi:Crp/Fnr family transcriptional regulator [Candidatus Bipolaricaulota bacterium]|nr:Crp/Fnr family transcriptional regulator [Candidatus Bipolaricaulota bacterium]